MAADTSNSAIQIFNEANANFLKNYSIKAITLAP